LGTRHSNVRHDFLHRRQVPPVEGKPVRRRNDPGTIRPDGTNPAHRLQFSLGRNRKRADVDFFEAEDERNTRRTGWVFVCPQGQRLRRPAWNTTRQFRSIESLGGGEMNSMARDFFKSGFLVILMCAIVWGQTSTASISGSVVDQSGAVLPGVEITVTQTET